MEWKFTKAAGGLATFLGIASVGIYLLSPVRADPQFKLRFCGVDQAQPRIYGAKSYLVVGVSTERSETVVLRSVTITPVVVPDALHFHGNDFFTLTHAEGPGVALSWNGEERIPPHNFLLVSVPYETNANFRSGSFVLISVMLTGHIAPESWGLPWSLVSLPTKRIEFARHVVWKATPDVGEETGFRVEPMESVRLTGEAARDSLTARGKGGWNLDVTEIFQDGSYKRSRIFDATKADQSPSPLKP
jgi:hypothetical protein